VIDFRLINSDDTVVDYLAEAISRRLFANQKVLWLTAGGSAMDIAVKTARSIKRHPSLANLTISLTDERYGPAGHPDSNWRQLQAKGFELERSKMLPVLTEKSLDDTVKDYAKLLADNLVGADYALALAGMGPDGHIFGIKPGSPATDSDDLVAGYKWDDFTRVTPTAKLISQLDEVVVYAAGAEKQAQIDKLDEEIPVIKQPAQLLKRLERVVFFNDHKGGKI
jgi:6-phosphogluconolactonase/glucosamine-6-phosphate isomerase/deaminase